MTVLESGRGHAMADYRLYTASGLSWKIFCLVRAIVICTAELKEQKAMIWDESGGQYLSIPQLASLSDVRCLKLHTSLGH
jgi:hypothetical protein